MLCPPVSKSKEMIDIIDIEGFLKQICSVPLVSIFPKTCGICGKIDKNALCPKCRLKLKKFEKNELLNSIDIDVDLNRKNNLGIKSNFYFDEIMYVFKYEGLIRKLILDYKFNEQSYLYLTFTNFFINNEKIFEKIKSYDKIIPVPISKKRLKTRGYNQSLLIANEIAKLANLEIVNNCLFKTKNIIEQSKLNREDRFINIQGVYELKNKSLIENKKILIFDDIYTTGSTVNECSKVLSAANPSKIGVLVLAKD